MPVIFIVRLFDEIPAGGREFLPALAFCRYRISYFNLRNVPPKNLNLFDNFHKFW